MDRGKHEEYGDFSTSGSNIGISARLFCIWHDYFNSGTINVPGIINS
jgi:hypothetical protein